MIMRRKDLRMNFTNEAVNNIKTLKFYSWVGIYEEEI
jgi:ABC-type multidrug transport system fused ATPase/permease subunit